MRNDILEAVKYYIREERSLLNKSEMARRFNCDPRTIDRYLKIQSGEYIPTKSKRIYHSKIDDYKEIIVSKVDGHGASAMAVYKFIEKKGYTGKYASVAAFVSNHKKDQNYKATIRFETSPGLQAQVDWKENITMVSKYGEIFKINIFLMVLGFSRRKYICLTSDRSQDTLFKCLLDAFSIFEGIPQEILFDNMKTVVDRAKSSFTRVELNETFRRFSKDAGFKVITCRPYRPQTKGKVEALAKLMDRLVVYNEEFEDYKDLERIVSEFQQEINNEISQATGEKPIERFKKEKEYLLPIPPKDSLLSYIFREKEYKVGKDSMITYKGKKYSVPPKYLGKKLTVTTKSDSNISIYYNSDFIVCHSITDEKYHYKVSHMHEILKSDVCKHLNDEAINEFIATNLSRMDLFLGE